MPALDKTGPQGQGPMTGRGLGCCGTRCGCDTSQTKEERIKDIKAYKKALQEQMEEADKELADLQK